MTTSWIKLCFVNGKHWELITKILKSSLGMGEISFTTESSTTSVDSNSFNLQSKIFLCWFLSVLFTNWFCRQNKQNCASSRVKSENLITRTEGAVTMWHALLRANIHACYLFFNGLCLLGILCHSLSNEIYNHVLVLSSIDAHHKRSQVNTCKKYQLSHANFYLS